MINKPLLQSLNLKRLSWRLENLKPFVSCRALPGRLKLLFRRNFKFTIDFRVKLFLKPVPLDGILFFWRKNCENLLKEGLTSEIFDIYFFAIS
jgi:hypothetical protein